MWMLLISKLKAVGFIYTGLIDKDGNLVDVYLSDVRDQQAAEQFFKQCIVTTGVIPKQITTDKEPTLYQAIKNVFVNSVKHRYSKYMNNII